MLSLKVSQSPINRVCNEIVNSFWVFAASGHKSQSPINRVCNEIRKEARWKEI